MIYGEKELILLNDPKSPIAEAYRVLRTNLQFSSVDKPLHSIVITSSGPGEGKTITICNVGITFALAGNSVLLVDADLRKPKVHKVFNIPNKKGLTNVLALREDYVDCIHKGPASNLDVLPSGAVPPNPSELLASRAMKELLGRLIEQYDYVFFDAPPVGVVTDASILSTIADGVIIVAASRHVDRDALRYSKEMLDKVGANILGVVLNRVSRNEKGGYYYYYYYDDDTAITGRSGKRK